MSYRRRPLTRREMSADLKDMAENDLNPDPEFQTFGERAAHQVVQRLQRHGGFRVARSKIAGSMGKGTAVKNSDFDLVVVMNIDPPPFDRSLFEEMDDCLSSLHGYSFIKVTRHSLQFKFTYKRIQCEFDLLPASNLVVPNFITKENVQEIMAGRLPAISAQQARIARRLMDRYWRLYESTPIWFGSALAERTVLFMLKRPKEALLAIKLAKHWNDQILGMPYIAGRSYLMELIALEAYRRNKGCSLIQRFIDFLNLMADFSNLQIFFGYYYHRSSIPGSILARRCYVMDPCNPYNNLCHRMKRRTMSLFEEHAKMTLRKLAGPIYDVNKIFDM